jgi:hypothetical protein
LTSGSVLVHCDKYRGLFPTTNSSLHPMVLQWAEPDGNEAQTAYQSRKVLSRDRAMQQIGYEPRSLQFHLLPIWLSLHIFHMD